jgi:hypothetical protein
MPYAQSYLIFLRKAIAVVKVGMSSSPLALGKGKSAIA